MQMPPANLVTGRGKSQDSHSALGTKAREAAISNVMSRGFFFTWRLSVWGYRYIIEIRWEWLCFQENVGADSPRNEVQRWFLVISKSWQTEAAGLLLELWMQMSRGCCDFLKLHPVDGNYPSGNQHSPVWEKQRSSSSTLWLGICSFPGGYM